MSRRNRERRPARQEPFLDPKPMILVVCEGRVTEKEYIEGFAGHYHNSRVRVDVRGGAGVPVSVVDRAKTLKKASEESAEKLEDDNLRFEEVWCIFDVDDHDVSTAIRHAKDVGIFTAVSNPCFEIWLWLHFTDQPGIQPRHQLCSMLKEFLPSYDKHVCFEDFLGGYRAAVRRAKQLGDDHKANPHTGVWKLTEKIRLS